MSKYTDWQERDAALHEFHAREERDAQQCCTGCGIALANHAAPATVCCQLQDLWQLVIDWHLGEEQARAKLRDAADAEIERRTGGRR